MRGAVALTVLLLASPNVVAWAQAGGGPGHGNVADLPPILDITGLLSLAPEGWTLAPTSPVLEAAGGLVALVQQGEGQGRVCQVAWTAFDDDGARPPVAVGQAQPCPELRADPGAAGDASPLNILPANLLLAVDAERDDVLVCLEGDGLTAPVVRAVQVPDGRESWSFGPAPGALGPGPGAGLWACGTPALDTQSRTLYLPLRSNDNSGVIVAYDLDTHAVRWSASPVVTGLACVSAEVCAAAGDTVPDEGFLPTAITATTSGLAVLGYLAAPDGTTSQPAYATLSFEGAIVNGIRPRLVDSAAGPLLTDDVPSVIASLSPTAAAVGSQAAFLMGDVVHVIDPATTDYSLVPIPFPVDAQHPAGGGAAWSAETLAVPGDFYIGVAPAAQPTAHVLAYRQYRVREAILDTGNQLHALVLTPTPEGIQPTIVAFDLATGNPLQRILGPFAVQGNYRPEPGPLAMTAARGGLLVSGLDGQAMLLGESTRPRPTITVSNLYPALSEPVTVQATADGATAFTVAWGDPVFSDADAGPFVRAFHEEALRQVRVTAVFPDGTTSTSVTTLHVGKEPPAELNFMQRAFSAEYQNWTFFILGLLVTVAGAILAIIGRRRSQSRIHAELAALDQIAQQGRSDPLEARRDLDDFERDLRERLAHGRLRDTQYDILDRRARDVRRDLG